MGRQPYLKANTRDSYRTFTFTTTKDLTGEQLSVSIYLADDAAEVEIDVTAVLLAGLPAGQTNTVALNLIGNGVNPGTYYMVVRDSEEMVNKSLLHINGPDAYTLRNFAGAGSSLTAFLEGGLVLTNDDQTEILTS